MKIGVGYGLGAFAFEEFLKVMQDSAQHFRALDRFRAFPVDRGHGFTLNSAGHNVVKILQIDMVI